MSGSTSLPVLVVALAVLAALIVLASAGWGLARLRGWEPRWAQALSHAMAEAGYHVETTWAEFSDWVRLRR